MSEKTMEFQTEVKQLLGIVINSLYTEKEIFLRELISNAADALEKLRYHKLTGSDLRDAEMPLEISIETDNIAHTLTINDTGVGMTGDELVENLGTIAHSGSKSFVKELLERGDGDISLIGQFGVGFYAAFMVAEKVTIFTRSYKQDAEGCIWNSQGAGEYSISKAGELRRGTKIVLHLKEDSREFGREETVQRIIKQYSGFVPFPISLNGKRVNTVQALWTKNKNEVTEEEIDEFYKYIANAGDQPFYKFQFTADAPLTINSLLFVPRDNLERHGFGRLEPGVNLYCRKVLIQEKSEAILPDWLRFVKGVVDSEELPLNISRETMQDSALVSKLRRIITGRFLKFLEEQAKDDQKKYREFWGKFGMFIKEGAATDFGHKEELLKLLRFESSKAEPGQLVSLDDYLDRLQPDQQAIYYINGTNRKAIEAGPYLEAFREKEIEVLYTFEAVDDYIFGQLGEYQGKRLISADQENLELPGDSPDAQEGLAEAAVSELTEWLKKVLGDRVSEVRKSKRLVNSPAVVLSPQGLTTGMQRIMQLMEQGKPDSFGTNILEVNTAHPLLLRLQQLRREDEDFAKIAAEQILTNALISAGLTVDQGELVDRVYQIMERALEQR